MKGRHAVVWSWAWAASVRTASAVSAPTTRTARSEGGAPGSTPKASSAAAPAASTSAIADVLLALGERRQEQGDQPGVGQGDVDQELEDAPVPRGPVRQVAHLVEHPPSERLGLAEDGLVQRLLAGEVVQETGLGQADGVGDLLDGGLGEAASGEECGRPVEDAVLDLVAERSGHATTVRRTDQNGR